MRILTDEEVLSLESFLVEDNETTVAVRVENGIKGVGGSNTSGFMAGSSLQISLEELDGGSPWAISALEICSA